MNYLLCVVGGLLSTVGGVLFKRWAIHDQIIFLIVGSIVYSFDAFVWAYLLRRGSDLSTGGALWSAVGLIVGVFAGLLFYGEQISISQGFGITFVLVGIVLLR